jgi:GNAT superfamily N-acetyltransferase
MTPGTIQFEPMSEQDTNAVVRLIAEAMNENEGKWAKKTINFHYFCKNHDVDDGRKYIVAKSQGDIVGITGLHNYNWGPEDVTWLGWFAVSPLMQGKKLGYRLMNAAVAAAKEMGYRKIFVETYSTEEFARARAFYEKFGYSEVGHIAGYINQDTHMVVYGLDIK